MKSNVLPLRRTKPLPKRNPTPDPHVLTPTADVDEFEVDNLGSRGVVRREHLGEGVYRWNGFLDNEWVGSGFYAIVAAQRVVDAERGAA